MGEMKKTSSLINELCMRVVFVNKVCGHKICGFYCKVYTLCIMTSLVPTVSKHFASTGGDSRG